MFKKKLLVAAILSAAVGAAAAAEVTVFGTVDTGMRYMNVKQDGHHTDSMELVSGDNLSPAVGIKGEEKINDDVTVFFHLEQGYYLDDGSRAFEGRTFGREATLGLKGDFGTVAVGRMGSIGSAAGTYDLECAIDAFGAGYTDAGIQATIVETSRLDNAITYVSPRMAGLQATLQYSNQLGYTDTSVEQTHMNENTRYVGAGLNYQVGNLNATLMYEREIKPSSLHAEDATLVTGGLSYDFGFATVYGAYQHGEGYGDNSQFAGWFYEPEVNGVTDYVNKNDSFAIGLGAPLGENVWLMTSVQYIDGETLGGKDAKRIVGGVGAIYTFSKRTQLYSALSYSDGKDALDNIGLDRTVVNFGISHTF